MPLSPGQILNGRYRIVKVLGQGGFGTVYRAWDVGLNTPWALKENLKLSLDVTRQFEREAQILASLSHRNLPRVIDHFLISGQGQYLVMDFIEGEDLQQMLDRVQGPLPIAQVSPWLEQICDALHFLHSNNIIHRDLKPANIKITPQGKAMLVDFGIAKFYDPNVRTTKGAQGVTPGYSPPEQYGRGITDMRTDEYALAATLYTLLTGLEPVEAPQRLVADTLMPAHIINPQIPPQLGNTLQRALSTNPSQRYHSIQEFQRAITASPVSQPTQWVKPTWLTPQIIGAGAGALMLLCVAIMVLGIQIGRWTFSFGTATSVPTAVAGVTLPPGVTASPSITMTPPLTFTPTYTPIPTETLTRTPSPTPRIPLKDGDTTISDRDRMTQVYISSGTFIMGSNVLSYPYNRRDAMPERRVTLDAFWIDKTEVTNAMYALCVQVGGCQPPNPTRSETRLSYYGNPQYGDYPVIYVSWNDANAYCNWAGRRLPPKPNGKKRRAALMGNLSRGETIRRIPLC
jgi:serine/threonine protein kinase